jgi:hypothetical protein
MEGNKRVLVLGATGFVGRRLVPTLLAQGVHRNIMTRFFTAFLLLFLALPTAAEKLYRYRDASGNWAFSDRPPAGTVPAEVRQVRTEGLPGRVGLRNLGTQEEPIYYAVNEYFGPVELEVSLDSGSNVRSEPPLPLHVMVPARSEEEVVRFIPANPRHGWSYRFAYRFSFGDLRAVHRPPRPYRPPLAPGEKFPVSQSFHGAFSHTEPSSAYAVDIAMPEGTPVHAAREGVVMEIANDFYGSGLDLDKYGDRANFICILHDDGTMAFYAHLQLETSQVAPGSRVEVGQLLGFSGNTGYSGGPHLHFVLQRNAGMELVSVPFKFDNGNGVGFVPE